jgi:uncharacterized protein (UPF0264 family)
MGLGNGNPKEGDKGSNFFWELKVLQGLEAIAEAIEAGGGGGGYSGAPGFASGGAGGSGRIFIKIPSTNTATFSGGVTQSSTTSGGFKIYDVTATSTTSETVTFS